MTRLTLEEFIKAIIPPSPNTESRLTICKAQTGQVRIMGPDGKGKRYTCSLVPYPLDITSWVIINIENGTLIESAEKVSADCGVVTRYEYFDQGDIPYLKH